MKLYLGFCEHKWTHANTSMEKIWIMRKIGEEIYKIVETNGWTWHLEHKQSSTLPGDIYCLCDIYIDIPTSKQATYFILKYPQATKVEKVI